MKRWPFPSSDPRVAPAPTPQPVEDESSEEFDSPYCLCNNELTQQEIDTGKCAACGKAVLA